METWLGSDQPAELYKVSNQSFIKTQALLGWITVWTTIKPGQQWLFLHLCAGQKEKQQAADLREGQEGIGSQVHG